MENAFDARAMIRKGTVTGVDDTGPVQMVTVNTGPGANYTAEVIQPFGVASVPPVNGCTAVLFCIGGDPANMVAVLTNPSKRFGNQAQGESVLYSAGNSRVAIRQGGTIQILGFTEVDIIAPNANITCSGSVAITAPAMTVTSADITLVGSVTVDGAITTTGTIHAGGGIH